MSTGADCEFFEKTPGAWFYRIQKYPYGATEDYTTHGPFPTFVAARKHLDRHYANPGGWSVEALPGCKHDMLVDGWRKGEKYCERCGGHVREKEVSK